MVEFRFAQFDIQTKRNSTQMTNQTTVAVPW